jgi:hypothetical protein
VSFPWWRRERFEQLVEAFVALGQPALGACGGVEFPRLEGGEGRSSGDQGGAAGVFEVTSSSTSVSGAAS